MSDPLENHHPLRQNPSDPLYASPTLSSYRKGYQSLTPQGSRDFAMQNPSTMTSIGIDPVGSTQGLGISGPQMSINRVPVGTRTPPSPSTPSKPAPARNITFTPSSSSPQTPGSSKFLLSPRSERHDSGTFTYDGDGSNNGPNEDISRNKRVGFDEYEVNNSYEDVSMDNYNDKAPLTESCSAKHDIHNPRASWISISILILSIYSTVFSGIWLTLAIVQPRYGKTIHSGGRLTPVTASTIFALFSKTIELSFVTVFVTFLGQVLTRRSLVKASRGVTLAEFSMRAWVIQPGFMITHWQHVQHAVLSILGIITLTAAFVAMFYTTASDSLVSPHLKYGKEEHKVMLGLVKTSYANPFYIPRICLSPISEKIDPLHAGETCLAVLHSGQAYHNSLPYLATWEKISIGTGNEGSPDLAERPPPIGTLNDNTAVQGSWVETKYSNMGAAYAKYGRIINNVTMSMPHAGVYAAAHDPINNILQPEDLAGVGEYSLKASVVSPTLNVLCANLKATELAPLIYSEWGNTNKTNLISTPGQMPWSGYEGNITEEFASHPFLNSTVVDKIFEWGPNYTVAGRPPRLPPVFPMFPIDYNSIINITVAQSDSNYLLVKSPNTSNYTLCQIRSWASTNCSTRYTISGTTGGHLESHCEDMSDKMSYNRSEPASISTDYRNVASLWMLATSMNTGISSANASSSRLLSQFVPYEGWGDARLDPLKPSIAEALAVMAGSTLLLSSTDSTFLHFWNYSTSILEEGKYLPFNASLASQQYASGYTAQWQGMFYVVLALVFATNVFCLVYFFLRSGLVTDYTEPQNLFALAINSPPSQRLGGSCGAGPRGNQLNVDWHVGQEVGSNHFFIQEGSTGIDKEMGYMKKRQAMKSKSSYDKLSNKRKSWL